jgi:hypothetical protein
LFGPRAGKWAVLVGGSFPGGDVLGAAEPALESALFRFVDPERTTMVGPHGIALARVEEGAFAGASDARVLDRVRARRAEDPRVPRTGAGALVIRFDRPGVPESVGPLVAPLGDLAELRLLADWGSPLPVEIELVYRNEVPPDAEARARRVLGLLLFDHLAVMERTAGRIALQPAGNRTVRGRVFLDDTALEMIADRARVAVSERIEASGGK